MRRNRVLIVFALIFAMSAAVFWLGSVLAAATLNLNEGLTVSEGASDTIDNSLLQADDPDAPGAILTYTIITAPINGSLMRDGVTLMASDTFTQTDIDNSLITYEHDNSETSADSFDFTVATSNTTAPTATFTITISPVFDEVPNVDDQIFSVDENSTTGTAVGTIITTDLDTGDSLTYTITGGNFGTPFAVGSNDGAITVDSEAPLDFETNQSLTFTVEVEDMGMLTDTAVITVNINDLFDEPPILDDFVVPDDLPEDSGTSTFVGTVPAPTDLDAGDTYTYTITSGNPGPTFVIGPSNGNLTVAPTANLDFETTPIYSLTVQVIDNGMLTDSATITVNLEDVNEPPVTSNATFTPNENTGNGISIGFVDATDPEDDSLDFLITGGNTGSAFSVNPTSGEITVNDTNQLDFETTPSFTLTVDVDDDVNPAVEATVFIDLNDLNESPTVNNASLNVDENSGNGTAVGTVTASDPDIDDDGALIFAILSGNTGGAFAIANDGSNNGAITVANSSQLDYETTQTFTLGIIVTDTGGLENTATVTIDINNLFDEPPVVSDATFFVSEDSSDGVVVGTVSATDPELASGDELTYAITGGNTSNVFAINSSSGQITVPDTSKLDADAMPTFNLTVQVTDKNGNPDTGIVTVNVTPLPITTIYLPVVLNDYPPVEPNNNCSQSYGISTGTDYEFTADDTEDWYAVTLASGGNLNVTLSSFEPAQGQLIVYGGSCSGLTVLQNDGSPSTTKTVNLTGLSAGTYYIRVFSSPITNTTYNLRVN